MKKDSLRNVLNHFSDLDYPQDSYEIIIVDGMSTDKTRDLVQKYPVRLLLNERKNVAAARNLGVKNARGDLVAFTDGDCKVDLPVVEDPCP